MLTLESAFTGAVASSLANTVVYPLDRSKTIIQTQLRNKDEESKKYNNVIECIIEIFKESGFKGLYQGLSASVFGNFVQTFSYFFCYSVLKKEYIRLKGSQRSKLSTIEELSLGIVSASFGQLFTNPINVISTRQQTINDSEKAKFVNVVKQIYKESNGDITQFWKGLKVGLVLTVNPSITYTSYQKLKTIIFTNDANNLGPLQNFILGVLSKAISTMATQPLIVAKASLQRASSKFKSFQEVLLYIYKSEGLLGLWKGLIPQLSKGVIVQGLLFTFRGEITRAVKQIIFIYLRFLKIQEGRPSIIRQIV